MIWLRNSHAEGEAAGHGVGFDGDVLRREQLGVFVEIDAGYEAMRARCEALLEAARAEAQALREQAEAEAQCLVGEAEARYAVAAREGREAGLREALADWHARVAQAPAADGATPSQRQRGRLAELVVLAVEKIVAASDPVDLYRRAATTLDAIVSEGSPLDVRVNPAALEAATRAFAETAAAWREAGRAVRVRVRADAALEAGACLCESDLGAVNASLDQQLAATCAAIERAVRGVADEDGPPADVDVDFDADAGEAADASAPPGAQDEIESNEQES